MDRAVGIHFTLLCNMHVYVSGVFYAAFIWTPFIEKDMRHEACAVLFVLAPIDSTIDCMLCALIYNAMQ